jgi:hypothetical protein
MANNFPWKRRKLERSAFIPSAQNLERIRLAQLTNTGYTKSAFQYKMLPDSISRYLPETGTEAVSRIANSTCPTIGSFEDFLKEDIAASEDELKEACICLQSVLWMPS